MSALTAAQLDGPSTGYPAWFAPLADLQRDPPPSVFSRLARHAPRAVDGNVVGGQVVDGVRTRRSAVLMLFADDPARVLLTRRASSLRSHAGQVAFPGGGIDAADAGPEAAALREAVEETGLDPSGVRIVGALPAVHLWVTRWDVTPVLAWWAAPSPVGVVDPAEVDAVAEVPLDELLDPANRFSVAHPTGMTGPAFRVRGGERALLVWGFTAMLLSEVLALGGLERPWDPTRTEAMP